MLVLTRKPQQTVQIGENITVKILRVRGKTIQLGIEAPKSVNVVRSELRDRQSAAEPSVGEGDDSGPRADDGDALGEQPNLVVPSNEPASGDWLRCAM